MGIHLNWYLNKTNSKRTLEGYERYWKIAIDRIGKGIKEIVGS